MSAHRHHRRKRSRSPSHDTYRQYSGGRSSHAGTHPRPRQRTSTDRGVPAHAGGGHRAPAHHSTTVPARGNVAAGTRLHVANLHDNVTTTQLLGVFSRHGAIVEPILHLRRTAFVQYATAAAVSRALMGDQGTLMCGQPIKLSHARDLEDLSALRQRCIQRGRIPHPVVPPPMHPVPVVRPPQQQPQLRVHALPPARHAPGVPPGPGLAHHPDGRDPRDVPVYRAARGVGEASGPFVPRTAGSQLRSGDHYPVAHSTEQRSGGAGHVPGEWRQDARGLHEDVTGQHHTPTRVRVSTGPGSHAEDSERGVYAPQPGLAPRNSHVQPMPHERTPTARGRLPTDSSLFDVSPASHMGLRTWSTSGHMHPNTHGRRDAALGPNVPSALPRAHTDVDPAAGGAGMGTPSARGPIRGPPAPT